MHYVIMMLYNYVYPGLVADVEQLPVEKVSNKNLDTGSAGVLEVKLVVFTYLLPFFFTLSRTCSSCLTEPGSSSLESNDVYLKHIHPDSAFMLKQSIDMSCYHTLAKNKLCYICYMLVCLQMKWCILCGS